MVQQSKIQNQLVRKILIFLFLFLKLWHCLSWVVDFSYLFFARTIHYKCTSEIQVSGLSGRRCAVFFSFLPPRVSCGYEGTWERCSLTSPINEASSHILEKQRFIPLAHAKLFLIKGCAKYWNGYLKIQIYSWSWGLWLWSRLDFSLSDLCTCFYSIPPVLNVDGTQRVFGRLSWHQLSSADGVGRCSSPWIDRKIGASSEEQAGNDLE